MLASTGRSGPDFGDRLRFPFDPRPEEVPRAVRHLGRGAGRPPQSRPAVGPASMKSEAKEKKKWPRKAPKLR